MTKRYKSKIDTWILVVYIGLVIVGLGVGTFLLLNLNNTMAAISIALFLAVIAVVLPLWTLLRTNYTISDQELIVRAGPFRWHVAITSIRSITRSHELEASPAFSLNRVRIDYGNASHILISPHNMEEFLAHLQQARATSRVA